MLFRFTNASVSFQELINDTLREELNIFIIVYLDDILIFLDKIEEYIEYIY